MSDAYRLDPGMVQPSSAARSLGIRLSDTANELIVANDAGAIRKEYTRLVYRLFLSHASKAPRVVSFTGVDEAANSRSVCANVGKALAFETSLPVCIVNIDWRVATMSEVNDGEVSAVGLEDAFVRATPVMDIARSIRGNLWSLSSGAAGNQISPLLTSARLGELVSKLRSEFHYTLMWCSSIVSEPAWIPVCATADATVVVIGRKSTRSFACDAVELLRNMNIPVAGAVLEQLRS